MKDGQKKIFNPGSFAPALLFITLVFASVFLLPSRQAMGAEENRPGLIAIIIDDLGNQLSSGRRAVALQAPLAYAVIPHTAFGRTLAREAHGAGKEVMLHFPMQPMQMEHIAGPGEISLENSMGELHRILYHNLDAVPHAVGINNHMGSLITRHPGHMRWLMEALAARGDLFFIDSFTTAASVAYDTALESGVPAARRHVFLDDDPDAANVAEQFARLKRQALKRGYAIGIGHPYSTTLELLERELPELEHGGEFRLVPVSYIVQQLASGELQRESGRMTASLAVNHKEGL